MVYTLGILLIGGHFLLVTSMANKLSEQQSGIGFLLFLAFVVSSGFVVTRAQNLLERFLISRHVKKRPRSGWRVVVQGK